MQKTMISRLKTGYFRDDTPEAVIQDYYFEFIFPQIIAIIDSVPVLIADPEDAPEYGEADGGGKAGAWVDADKIYTTKTGRRRKGERWWQWLFRNVEVLENRTDWRATFGHELSHVLDGTIDLSIGFHKDVGQERYSQYVSDQGQRRIAEDHPGIPSLFMDNESYEILMRVFPCLREDHPEHVHGAHAFSMPEPLAGVIQLRTELGRDLTGRDIQAIRRHSSWKDLGLSAVSRSNAMLGDLRQLLNDCTTELNDEQIADELNGIV